MTTPTSDPRQRPLVRLWVISLALFVGGFLARVILVDFGDVAFGYPAAEEIQFYCYGAAVLVLFASSLLNRDLYHGCGTLVLAVVAGFVILLTIPK